MIVVRNVFQLKFGKAREALELWKEWAAMAQKASGTAMKPRILTDLVGDYYTLVTELNVESLSAYENWAKTTMATQDFKNWYQKFVPLVQSGRREVFNVVVE